MYVLPIGLRAARKFTGYWPPHKPHTVVSSVNCVGISRNLKSTIQDQNNVSTSFLSIIHDNLCQNQPVMSPVAADIDNSDFFLPLVKGVTRFIAGIQLLKLRCPTLRKTLVNAHFYRTVIVVTFLIKTRPYINTSVEMLNKMLYERIFVDFFC